MMGVRKRKPRKLARSRGRGGKRVMSVKTNSFHFSALQFPELFSQQCRGNDFPLLFSHTYPQIHQRIESLTFAVTFQYVAMGAEET